MTTLLTAREVADMLGVHPETVLRWYRRQQIPGFPLPSGAIRFREDALEAWIEERATTERGSANHPARAVAHGHATASG